MSAREWELWMSRNERVAANSTLRSGIPHCSPILESKDCRAVCNLSKCFSGAAVSRARNCAITLNRRSAETNTGSPSWASVTTSPKEPRTISACKSEDHIMLGEVNRHGIDPSRLVFQSSNKESQRLRNATPDVTRVSIRINDFGEKPAHALSLRSRNLAKSTESA